MMRTPFRPEDHAGIGQWPELQAMTNFFVDFEERGENYDWQAAMLAVIDQTPGALECGGIRGAPQTVSFLRRLPMPCALRSVRPRHPRHQSFS
jgi:hypothetical protein